MAQATIYAKWINAKLKETVVEDLLEDLKSGLVLYELLGELSGEDLVKVVGKPSKVRSKS